MKDTVLITLRLFQADPTQRDFCTSLESMIPGQDSVRHIGELHSTKAGLESGKSLMKKGVGSLMIDTLVTQFMLAGYGLNDAYVAHDDGRSGNLNVNVITKVTFAFRKNEENVVDLVKLFDLMTEKSGWQVKRYSNDTNDAFSCQQPSNMVTKIEKAAANGHPITPARLSIFS